MSIAAPGLYPIVSATRRWQELSGFWKFQLDPQRAGHRQNWKYGLPHPTWMAVPSSFNELIAADQSHRTFVGDAWYETSFTLPEEDREQTAELRFEGIGQAAELWLNGHKVGTYAGGGLPFAVPLHAAARFGQRNQLVVAISCKPDDGPQRSDRPRGSVAPEPADGRRYAGIERPVKLVFRPKTALLDLSLVPSLEGSDGVLAYAVTAGRGLVRVQVLDADGKPVASGEGAIGRLRIPDAVRWEPGAPYLYTFRASLYSASGRLCDEYELETGIRTLATAGTQLLLNGRPIYCKGFVLRKTFPLHGRGYDPVVLLRDVALLEWAGANTVHTVGPCEEEFLRLADRRGLLVVDSIPGCGGTDSAVHTAAAGVPEAQREELRTKLDKACKDRLREQIQQDKNHPSVLLWSLPVDAQTDTFAEELLACARLLDPQRRPVGLAPDSSTSRKSTACAEADVILLRHADKSTEADGPDPAASEALRAQLQAWSDAGKPLLVAVECLAGGEQAQCEALTRDFRVLDESGGAGELADCFADFGPDGPQPNGFRAGAFTQLRQPKQAAYLLKQRWNGREVAAWPGRMNILVTLNAAYIAPLKVMLSSLLYANPGRQFDVYILHSALSEPDLAAISFGLDAARCRLHPIQIQGDLLHDAPVTDRYPKEMYYRIFAAKYLPESLDRVLYLDPDMVVNGPLDSLYAMELGQYLFAAASHVKGAMQKLNELRLDMEQPGPYINSGVMLMHLSLLRREQNDQAVFRYIREHKSLLLLPDQDVISGIYASRILPLDPYRYNMTERLYTLRLSSEAWLDLDWVRRHSAIIHYCGRNKPWKQNYLGALNVFYQQAALRLERAEAEAKQR